MAEHREEPESETEEGLAQASPAAVAVALGRAARGSKGVDDDTRDFLRKHTHLIELQTEHLHEQRELQLAHLRVRRWRDRLGLALQSLGLIVGAAAVIGLAVMVWQAREDHGLVVEPFAVPPDMAARGVTGQVVAAKLLDKLTTLQAQTDSQRAPSTLANNWGDDIKLEIPETGVSVGEINRYLRQWLGHQTRVSGELLHTPTGVSLTTRTEGGAGQTAQGLETDLDGLAQQAAEAVYGQTQPYRYGVYLRGQNRMEDAQRVFTKLSTSGPQGERAWGYLGLANAYRDLTGPEPALTALGQAAQAAPWMFLAWQNTGDIDGQLGRLEAALANHRHSEKLLSRPDHGGIRPDMVDNTRARIRSFVDEDTGDFASAVRLRTGVVAFGRQGLLGSASALLVESDVADHDITAARAALNPNDTSMISPGKATYDNTRAAMQIDAASGDWPAVLAEWTRLTEQVTQWPGLQKLVPSEVIPMVAQAKAAMGDLSAAEALIATTPSDCDSCLRERGKLAALRRDWPAAERWFAQAARIAPSIPFADTDWGEMLLAKGDVDGAIARLAQAHAKSPRFADPLELWGEALIRKGDFAGAVARFAEADKYAPRWGRDHLHWAQALARLGRGDEARAQYRAASQMDLSAADRAELSQALVRG